MNSSKTIKSKSITIQTTYDFQCKVDLWCYNQAAKDFFFKSGYWKDACRMADKLNDLIEEYHAPGSNRRHRRALQRIFDKTFIRLKAHCQVCKIDYEFKQIPN